MVVLTDIVLESGGFYGFVRYVCRWEVKKSMLVVLVSILAIRSALYT